MEPALATSLLLAKHKADVAMAVAARISNMNPSAARRLHEAVSESTDEVERVAAEVAKGAGEVLDVFV